MTLGGIDDDERATFLTLIHHFALKLEEERRLTAALQRRLACAEDRLRLFAANDDGR